MGRKSELSLYEHNLLAYQSVMDLFASGKRRCCIIHPTGTGKSYIALRIIKEFSDKSVLYVTSYAKNRDEFLSKCEKYLSTKQHIIAVTYSGLATLNESNFGLIILDEFHRAGATQWGSKVEQVLHDSASAYVLGLSATPIRYLDNERNMANELFYGNVASEISLDDAIVTELLPFPNYISCVYSFAEDISKAEQTLQKVSEESPNYSKAFDLIQAAKHDLSKATGLREVFKQELHDTDKKFIVFCSSYEHMQEMIRESATWFDWVPEKHVYALATNADVSLNAKTYDEFLHDTSKSLRLLFCIDMLNEGVHVPDVDGVILLRPTTSLNIYFQQIGRALQTNQDKTPFIFDVVSNVSMLESVEHFWQGIIERCQHKPIFTQAHNFTVFAKHLRIQQLLEEFYNICGNWDLNYAIASQYYSEHGNLEVTTDCLINNLNLRRWLIKQRGLYSKGALSQERIQKLEKIGMQWDPYVDRWEKGYALASDYYAQFGNLKVPSDYCIDDFKLGSWILRQRNAYSVNRISDERISRLEQIGMIWNTVNNAWEVGYMYALRYYLSHNNLLVHADYVDNDYNLGTWIRSQRRAYRANRLSNEQVQKLESIEMIWDTREARWDVYYAAAQGYYTKYYNLNIPYSYVVSDLKLGVWISEQRTSYRNGELSQERILKLAKIGMQWNVKVSWEEYYRAACAYYAREGDLLIPAQYKEANLALGAWINTQRNLYKSGELPSDRKLALEKIHMVWSPTDHKWDAGYQHAKQYFKTNHHLSVPQSFKQNDYALGNWISTQRRKYKDGKLSKEQIEKLNDIGMIWCTNGPQKIAF